MNNTPRSRPSSYSTPSPRTSRRPPFSSPSSSLYGISPRQLADTEPAGGDPVPKKECVRVGVRLRPCAPGEQGDQVWTADSLLNRVHMEAEFNKNKQEIEYLFDRVFTGSDNTVVYEESVRDFMRASMEGFNATCFCAGQTATGKTFTMMGTDSQPGVIPQAVDDVFAYIRETSGDREFLLRVSYVEIYNETIRDLLAPEVTDVRIHEDQVRGVYVSPLKEEIVTTAKQVMRIIQKGEVIRRVSQTDYNLHSSVRNGGKECLGRRGRTRTGQNGIGRREEAEREVPDADREIGEGVDRIESSNIPFEEDMRWCDPKRKSEVLGQFFEESKYRIFK